MNSFCLLYTSALAPNVGAEVVAPITRTARRNNLRDGVTGLLVFDGEYFLQWVEGPPLAIEDLLVRLGKDDRHGELNIHILGERHTLPLFPDWQLAFHFADPQVGDIGGFAGLDQHAALHRFESMLPHFDLEIAARPGRL